MDKKISENEGTKEGNEEDQIPIQNDLNENGKTTNENEKRHSIVLDKNPKKLTMGTIPYIAPEILLGQQHDENVDWWSLGVIGYELVHGVPPWVIPSSLPHHERYQTLYKQITTTDLQFSPSFSAEFQQLISGLLTIDPQKRFGPEEVKKQPFFRGINWDLVAQKRFKGTFRPAPEAILFSVKTVIEGQLGLLIDEVKILTEQEQRQFSDWNWENPKYPSGLNPEEQDIIFFKSVQKFNEGLELYQGHSSRPRGRIIFSLQDIPQDVVFYTHRGVPIERKSPVMIMVGNTQVEIKNG